MRKATSSFDYETIILNQLMFDKTHADVARGAVDGTLTWTPRQRGS
jgi:hypothetical protein